MELTENMEEFLNDLIGKRMEQVYQEKDGEQYDPFNEELELKVQKVIRKLSPKQGKVVFVKGGFNLSFSGGLKMYDLGGLRTDRC